MSSKHMKYMRKAVMVSLFCNIILVLIKSTALVLVHSLAIAVDLGISFVGLAVSVILYYSIKLANRPADLIHNYGYGKVEHVCAAMEGVVLMGIALAMSFQAVTHLLNPRHVFMPMIGLVTSVVGSSLNFGGAYYIFKMARKSESPAVHAEGVHYKLEGFISAMIAGSFAVSMLLIANGKEAIAIYIDPLAALLVSGLVFIPSFKLAKRSFFKLLDASVGEDSKMEILKQLAQHIDSYCQFHDVKSRTSGRKKFVEFKLTVPQDLSLKESYKTISLLEDDIKSSIPNCDVLIKMQPCKKDCEFNRRGEQCPYLIVRKS
ncbi:MAG: cation diffusion facilitator family transporter [Candidatus Omnitrophota bacterium]